MSFYWITRLDAISTVAIVFAFMFIAFTIALCIYLPIAKEDMDEKGINIFTKLLRHSAIISVISLLVAIFTPTTKEMCAIYVVDYLKDNEKVQQLPDKIIDAATAYFEDLINEDKKED